LMSALPTNGTDWSLRPVTGSSATNEALSGS